MVLSLSFSVTLVTNNYYDRFAYGLSVIVNGMDWDVMEKAR